MFSLKIKKLEYLATNRGDLVTEDFLVSFIRENRHLITEENIDSLIEILELEDPVFKDVVFKGKDPERELDTFWLKKLRSYRL